LNTLLRKKLGPKKVGFKGIGLFPKEFPGINKLGNFFLLEGLIPFQTGKRVRRAY